MKCFDCFTILLAVAVTNLSYRALPLIEVGYLSPSIYHALAMSDFVVAKSNLGYAKGLTFEQAPFGLEADPPLSVGTCSPNWRDKNR